MTVEVTTGASRRSGTGGRSGEPQRRDQLVDLGFALVLVALGLLALRSAFGGLEPIRVGLVGFVAGTIAASAAHRRDLSPPHVVVVAVLVFLLFSGAAVPHVSPLGLLPTPEALSAVVRALVHGWKDSLTTAPPVGVEFGLGIVPYVAGFGGGLLGLLIAWRSRTSLAPASGPLLTLVMAIAFGDLSPASLALSGVGFGAVAVAWGAVRGHRDRRDLSGRIYWPRIARAGLMISVLAMLGFALGGPAIGGATRDVLRRDVDPPFDPYRYPSPMVGLRNYLADQNQDRHVLTVSGLPEGASLRVATLDTYDGVVWAMGGPEAPGSGRFDRVGTSILPTPDGTRGTVEVEVEDYSGVWVPTVGATESTRFLGPRADEQIAAYRFNRTTGDGASPAGLFGGDRYQLSVRHQEAHRKGADRSHLDDSDRIDLTVLRSLAPLPKVPDDLQERAVQMVQGETTDMGKALLLERTLQEGFYSNGGPDKKFYERSSPGHSMYRLNAFLLDPTRPRPVGDEEQYAAAMAFVARVNNLPARVVVGFTVPDEEYEAGAQEIRGGHADAWVEIAFEDHGWVRFDPTPPRDQTPEEQELDKPTPRQLEVQPEPKQDYLQPPDLMANSANDREEAETVEPDWARERGGLPPILVNAAKYVGAPMAAVGLAAGSVIFAKSVRERRRRHRGTPVSRLVGAWRQAGDNLRDFGVPVDRRPTRLEWAANVPSDQWAGATSLATAVEHAMFSPEPPTDERVTQVWAQVDAQRLELETPRSRRQRMVAALNPRSLRRDR